MQIARSVNIMQNMRLELPEPVGLVPTMGYLHRGHLSLIERARSENASVVVSIFVNPAQFGPGEDLACYPRDEKHDLELLLNNGVDVAFLPQPDTMYPDKFNTWVIVEKITQPLEGAARPGHFRGVATVCNKLFNIVRPSVAYFGQKDAQQALVIRKMVDDLNMNLKIKVSPTLRETDGLAMSSRNSYLRPDERQAATVLYKALCLASNLWESGVTDAQYIRQKMADLINQEKLASIDYVSISDTETLEEQSEVHVPALISLAVRIGKTRLIDNIILG
jgi:pantoate--beta-alanine ligase